MRQPIFTFNFLLVNKKKQNEDIVQHIITTADGSALRAL